MIFLKSMTESFNKKPIVEDTEYLSEAVIDAKIIETQNKLKDIKEKYEDAKQTWKALCEDASGFSFGRQLTEGSIVEQFKKVIDDLKMDYYDTKKTLDYLKDLKNKPLLEAEISLSADQLYDPSQPIKFREIAKQKDDEEKARLAKEEEDRKKAELMAKTENIRKAITDSDNPFETAFDLLVPDQGKAETLAGEMIRAMMRIMYRDHNDGDLFYESYGLETAAPAASFLMENGYWDEFEEIINKELRDDAYTQALENIRDKIVASIVADDTGTELLSTINDADMLKFDTHYIEENQPRYDYEVYASDDLDAHIEARNCDSWKLKEYVENLLSWEHDTRDAEIETPWSHYDTTVTITNLTKDGLDRVKEMFNHNVDGFWEDLVNELNDEYGIPGEEDEDNDEDDYEGDEDEDLDESLTLEEKASSLLDTFLKYHEDSSNFKNNPAGFSAMYRILNKYGTEDENVDDVFSKASEEDQLRMIELIAPRK